MAKTLLYVSLKIQEIWPFENSRSSAEVKTFDAHNSGLGGPRKLKLGKNSFSYSRPCMPKIRKIGKFENLPESKNFLENHYLLEFFRTITHQGPLLWGHGTVHVCQKVFGAALITHEGAVI